MLLSQEVNLENFNAQTAGNHIPQLNFLFVNRNDQFSDFGHNV